MDLKTVQDVQRSALIIDGAAKLEKALIRQISLSGTLFSSGPGGDRAPMASLIVKPGEPGFEQLEAMLRNGANGKKTAAQAVLDANGVTFTPDPAELARIEVDSAGAKAAFDVQAAQDAAAQAVKDAQGK